MPRFSGLEVLRALRRRGKKIPVIFISAFGSAELQEEIARFDNVVFLSKPFELTDLATLVAHLTVPAA